MKRVSQWAAGALLVAGAVSALAQVPQSLRAAADRVEQSFGVKIKDARSVGGLVEMLEESGQLVYTTPDGATLLVGDVIDVQTKRSISRERMEELSKFDPSTIPSKWTFSAGSGSRTLWVFTDPKCPFCKRLEPELDKLKDVKIVYVPLAYQRSDDMVAGVLCSRDKVAAWKKAIDGQFDGKSTQSCQKDTQDIKQFAQSKMITGTPTMVRADGKRLAGYTSAQEIEAFLGGK